MRARIYRVIEVSAGEDFASSVYDFTLIAVIITSLVPLAFKTQTPLTVAIDRASAFVFVIDYVLRIATADLKLSRGAASFFIYPMTPMAIIDLLSILPTFTPLSSSLRLLKVFRLFRAFRVLRAFKMARYSRSLSLIADVVREQREPLLAVAAFAGAYIVVSALVVFNVEPDTFDRFFDALYWATVSLTTVGYGDIYPVSDVGRIVTMVSSLLGIAVVALPAGIITAGYLDKLSAGSHRG